MAAFASTTAARPVQVATLGEDTIVTELPPEFAPAAGTRTAANISNTTSVGITAPAISAVTDAQFGALSGRVTTLENRVDALTFQLGDVERSANGGIAAAMALGQGKIVPDSGISMTVAASTYGGQQGFAGSLTGRLDEKVYVSAGVSGNTGDGKVGGTVSATFGF
ncbi:YadA-like family protein [Pontixanthobacter sp. CEM42]|uniref:YadA-like family protein n=1 Tax=Pontixanthobacter sp. CEM42 TaxID=2792077 RepID=UPI001AE07416|nr:YadA-like family protein [Pontixanthobacter sp. CEM42]